MVCASGEENSDFLTASDLALAQRAQKLVLWSLDEEKGKGVVLAALQLATDPNIAVPSIIRTLTFKAAQLLLADGKSSSTSLAPSTDPQ